MSAIAVTGWSALTQLGLGAQAQVAGLARIRDGGTIAGVGVEGLFEEPLPAPTGHAAVDFDVRAHLPRKGTGSYDRATALAVVCCQDALRAAGLDDGAAQRARIGVALGTSLGSFKSTSDYSRETLVQERPYLVNPLLFPNTVMNCAAGQVAIRLGLRGVNATITGGPLAFLNALRYARNMFARGYADVMLVGAVEEYSPHRAWAAHLTGATDAVEAGEAAAVFVLARSDAPQLAAVRPAARVLSVATAFGPGGDDAAALALRGCVRRALHQAGVDGARIGAVLTGEAREADGAEFDAVAGALEQPPRRLLAKRWFGECDAASGAVAMAALLAGAAHPVPGGLSLITGRGADGAVGAAIIEEVGDVGTDRG